MNIMDGESELNDRAFQEEDEAAGPNRPGFVYILRNPAMPSLVKIGRTDRHPAIRASELSRGSGVPEPFEVYKYWAVEDHVEAETWIHNHLSDRRSSQQREFFALSPREAWRLIEDILGRPVATGEELAAWGRCPVCNLCVDDAANSGLWDGRLGSDPPGGDILSALCQQCGASLISYAAVGEKPQNALWAVNTRPRRLPRLSDYGPEPGWQSDGSVILRQEFGHRLPEAYVQITKIKLSDTGRMVVWQWREGLYEEGEKGADSWEGWGDQFRSVRELLEPLRDRPIPPTTEEALLEAVAPEE